MLVTVRLDRLVCFTRGAGTTGGTEAAGALPLLGAVGSGCAASGLDSSARVFLFVVVTALTTLLGVAKMN